MRETVRVVTAVRCRPYVGLVQAVAGSLHLQPPLPMFSCLFGLRRNELMLQEAGEFANHLKKIEKDIRGLKNATEGRAGCMALRPCWLAAVWRHCESGLHAGRHGSYMQFTL
jgi:hypothetical protein